MTTTPTIPPPTPTGKSLFSRHYLDVHLPRHAEWAEDARPAFARLAELWARGQRLGATWNENQTETEFLRPALAALGWSFIPQAPAMRAGRLSRPDYALFRDDASRDAAYPLQGNDPAFYGATLAIAEAKHWGRPLSRQSADGREQWDASANPSHQMVNYLVGTRCPWGILTNGQVWRLYSREASSTASEFYEVDLGAVFDVPGACEAPGTREIDAFKRFWLFFRRDAFTPDSQGRNFVQRVAAGSASYAREVSDKLKELVYREVMPEVAGGFIAYRRERLGIGPETDASLAEIYRASLGLLYKLLFILYAEARGLLPVDNPAYHAESLTRLAAEFADRRQRGMPLSDATHATRQYDGLLALFHRIDLGDPSLGIPRYDGGLFNPTTAENRFLETHKLSDRAVARAVDILVYDAGEPVDYGYISVRNLGSIYEGLLENRLAVAAGASGALPSLRRDDNSPERKATGSYYTPDYIVDYIVRQTLGPVLDERQEVFTAAMTRCVELRRKLAQPAAAAPATNRLLRQQLAGAERDAREAFLGIKVCDPAMGSGHFLVNAVDFLTDGIIQRLQAYHDEHRDAPPEWNPIHQLVATVRRDISAELARQGIAVDPARLDDTSLLTRLVMKRCIYGVDLNQMAVELAKLSLWLHSFTVGAPLSFLDHHLRWGDSLIGADVRTVEAAIAATGSGQMALWGGPFAGLLDLTAVMTEVAGRADATLADVRQSADEFAAMQRALTPYKQALDLWVSQWFDEERPPAAAERSTATVEKLTDVAEKLTADSERSTAATGKLISDLERSTTVAERSTATTGKLTDVVEKLTSDSGKPTTAAEKLTNAAERSTGGQENPARSAKPRRSGRAALEFITLHGADVLPALRGERTLDERDQATIAAARRLWEEKRFFHWELEFPEVFVDLARRDWAANGGFDAVIGNPPYENAWTMTDIDSLSRQTIATIYEPTHLLQGHWDLWVAFFARALSIVRDGGTHSFIVPDAFAREKYAIEVRRVLLRDTSLLELMHFEGVNVFDEVSRHCLIYVINKSSPDSNAETRVVTPVSESTEAIKVGKVLQAEWLRSEGSQIRVNRADSRRGELIRHIERDSIKVGQFCYVMIGATTHSKDRTSFIKSSIVSSEPVGNAKRFFDGRNLSRYQIDWDGRYIDYRRDEMYGPRVPELFESPKVVVRDVTGPDERLLVSFDDSGLYCDHLVTCITYYENVMAAGVQTEFEGFQQVQPPYPSLAYLTSILTSKLITWYFREVFATGTLQGSYSHTYPQQVRALPIRRIAFTTPAADRARYAEESRQLYAGFAATGDAAPLLAFVDAHLSSGDPPPASSIRTDVIHDLLAALAEQMIAMNRAKQAEMQGFLAWLGREIGVAPNALTGKSRLLGYLGDYQKGEPHVTFTELLDILRKNRRQLAADPSGRAFQERLQTEYTASLAKLLPLKTRLAATDRLIDQVVYRLYGLTAAEIAVVEGGR